MLPSGNTRQAVWTYFNHDRLHSFLAKSGGEYSADELSTLMSHGAVDKFGVIQPLEVPPDSESTWTVFDYLPRHLRYPALNLYAMAVDELILRVKPLDIDRVWTKRELKHFLTPGTFVFSLRGFRFKEMTRDNVRHNVTRIGYAQKAGIRLEFMVNTKDMFGQSSIHNSFSGHRVAAFLGVFKGFSVENNILHAHCTPVAMGMGFLTRGRDYICPADTILEDGT
jgi:hypothetical protein